MKFKKILKNIDFIFLYIQFIFRFIQCRKSSLIRKLNNEDVNRRIKQLSYSKNDVNKNKNYNQRLIFTNFLKAPVCVYKNILFKKKLL